MVVHPFITEFGQKMKIPDMTGQLVEIHVEIISTHMLISRAGHSEILLIIKSEW